MIRTVTAEAMRQPQGQIPTNSHGCVAGKRCRCPGVYRRCSLFTRYAEYDEDPVLVDEHGATVNPRTCHYCGTSLVVEADMWVDAVSGDEGGTYDRCPGDPEDRGHYPTRESQDQP